MVIVHALFDGTEGSLCKLPLFQCIGRCQGVATCSCHRMMRRLIEVNANISGNSARTPTEPVPPVTYGGYLDSAS